MLVVLYGQFMMHSQRNIKLKLLYWIVLKLRYFKISIKILNDSRGHQMTLCLKLLKWRLLAKIMNHSVLSSLNTEY